MSVCLSLDDERERKYKRVLSFYEGIVVEFCRGCGIAEETVDHIINCGELERIAVEEVTWLEKDSSEIYITLQAQAKKIISFIEEYST